MRCTTADAAAASTWGASTTTGVAIHAARAAVDVADDAATVVKLSAGIETVNWACIGGRRDVYALAHSAVLTRRARDAGACIQAGSAIAIEAGLARDDVAANRCAEAI